MSGSVGAGDAQAHNAMVRIVETVAPDAVRPREDPDEVVNTEKEILNGLE